MCGLEHYMPLYTYVGSFDRLAEHSRHILTAKGLWDEYGADGWGKGTVSQRKLLVYEMYL